MGPPPDRSLKMRKSKPAASMPMARKRVSAARSSACPPPAPKMAAPVLKSSPLAGDDSEEDDDSSMHAELADTSYALEEQSISLAQVNRLFGKGKKKGFW